MRGKHIAPTRARTKWGVIGLTLGLALAMSIPALAGDTEGPNKVWVCHFDNHTITSGPDLNGSAQGYHTTSGGEYLDGDYVVTLKSGYSGPNQVQTDVCHNWAGELILVSVNAVGTEETAKGHRAQNLALGIASYPDGYKG